LPFLADASFDAALCLDGSLNDMTDLAAQALARRVTGPG